VTNIKTEGILLSPLLDTREDLILRLEDWCTLEIFKNAMHKIQLTAKTRRRTMLKSKFFILKNKPLRKIMANALTQIKFPKK
jgi:hypothetical protein